MAWVLTSNNFDVWLANSISVADLATKDHDLLDGLSDDDHTQYMTVNASRSFTSNVTITHATKNTLLTLTSGDSGCNLILEDDSSTGASYIQVIADDLMIGVDAVTVMRWDANGAGIDVTNSDCVLDDDTMAGDDPKRLATQQSIKAYADLMLPLTGGNMAGTLNMAGNAITNAAYLTIFGSDPQITMKDSGAVDTSDYWQITFVTDDLHVRFRDHSAGTWAEALTLTMTGAASFVNAVTITHATEDTLLTLSSGDDGCSLIIKDNDTTGYFGVKDNYQYIGVNRAFQVHEAAPLDALYIGDAAGGDIQGACIKDEDDMASNSAIHLATQQSIKAYADLMLPLTGGTMTGALEIKSTAATIRMYDTDYGDGLDYFQILKSGAKAYLRLRDVSTSSWVGDFRLSSGPIANLHGTAPRLRFTETDAGSGSDYWDAYVATSSWYLKSNTAAGTSTYVLAFNRAGEVIVPNSSCVKDEDDMVSDSAVHLATQQSIKAYVDSSIQSVWTFGSQVDVSGGATTYELTTAINSAITEIDIYLNGVSINTTQTGIIQVGTATGYIVTSSYYSVSRDGSLGSFIELGFTLWRAGGWGSSYTATGVAKLRRWDTGEHLWFFESIVVGDKGHSNLVYSGGHVTLPGEMTSVQLAATTSGGWDAGEARVKYR